MSTWVSNLYLFICMLYFNCEESTQMPWSAWLHLLAGTAAVSATRQVRARVNEWPTTHGFAYIERKEGRYRERVRDPTGHDIVSYMRCHDNPVPPPLLNCVKASSPQPLLHLNFGGLQGNSRELRGGTPNLGTFCPFWGVLFLHFEGFLSFSWDFPCQEAVMQFATRPPPLDGPAIRNTNRGDSQNKKNTCFSIVLRSLQQTATIAQKQVRQTFRNASQSCFCRALSPKLRIMQGVEAQTHLFSAVTGTQQFERTKKKCPMDLRKLLTPFLLTPPAEGLLSIAEKNKKNTYFHNVRAIRANRLKPAICNF